MRRYEGFTLIELLVVIAIIGILVGIVQPMLSASASRSRELRCESNLNQISVAMQAYTEDYGTFPARLAQLDSTIRDKEVLMCSRSARGYHYRSPGEEASRDAMIVSCIDPRRTRTAWPHRHGGCYLALTAGGEVRKVARR